MFFKKGSIMKRLLRCKVIAALQLLVAVAVSPVFADDGALSSGVIEEIQSTFKMDAHTRDIQLDNE